MYLQYSFEMSRLSRTCWPISDDKNRNIDQPNETHGTMNLIFSTTFPLFLPCHFILKFVSAAARVRHLLMGFLPFFAVPTGLDVYLQLSWTIQFHVVPFPPPGDKHFLSYAVFCHVHSHSFGFPAIFCMLKCYCR